MSKLNAVNWFEIIVTDFDRAKKFYESILATPLAEHTNPMGRMAMFPFDMEKGVGGAITQMEGFTSGAGGTVVYLNVEGDLDGVIARTPAAGGEVLRPKFPIGPWGFIAILKDTEGNVFGVHSLT
jgi:hypothetical protein